MNNTTTLLKCVKDFGMIKYMIGDDKWDKITSQK